jgi:hypothetical protein
VKISFAKCTLDIDIMQFFLYNIYNITDARLPGSDAGIGIPVHAE